VNRIAICWDSYRCWRSASADYTAFLENNCAGLGEEEGTGKALVTKQKSHSLQVQH